MLKRRKPILLVEDDVIDVMTIKRAFQECKIANQLIVTGNGEEALAFLKDARQELPCIVLMDLQMPKMNGVELLRMLKNDPQLKRIPVVVLTTSYNEHDRLESFELGVAGYMVKPVDYEKFREVVKTINRYWTLSELPEQ